MDVYKHSLAHGIKLMLFFGFHIIQKATLTSNLYRERPKF